MLLSAVCGLAVWILLCSSGTQGVQLGEEVPQTLLGKYDVPDTALTTSKYEVDGIECEQNFA